jgi:intracellular septation protein
LLIFQAAYANPGNSRAARSSQRMKLLADFLPVILFFVAYKVADIYVATGVAIVAAIVHLVWLKLSRQTIKPVHWIGLGFILLFGSMTILLKDPFYIKIKWTLFYGLMGALIVVFTALGKNPLKTVFGNEIELPPEAWHKFSFSWGGFFLVLAVLNQYFAMTLSLDAWVNVKVWGGMAATLVFVIGQALWLAKYFPDEAPAAHCAANPAEAPKEF